VVEGLVVVECFVEVGKGDWRQDEIVFENDDCPIFLSHFSNASVYGVSQSAVCLVE
jgi:hypothetical protein